MILVSRCNSPLRFLSPQVWETGILIMVYANYDPYIDDFHRDVHSVSNFINTFLCVCFGNFLKHYLIAIRQTYCRRTLLSGIVTGSRLIWWWQMRCIIVTGLSTNTVCRLVILKCGMEGPLRPCTMSHFSLCFSFILFSFILWPIRLSLSSWLAVYNTHVSQSVF